MTLLSFASLYRSTRLHVPEQNTEALNTDPGCVVAMRMCVVILATPWISMALCKNSPAAILTNDTILENLF